MVNLWNNFAFSFELAVLAILVVIITTSLFFLVRRHFRADILRLKKENDRLNENWKEAEKYYQAELRRGKVLEKKAFFEKSVAKNKVDEPTLQEGVADGQANVIRDRQELLHEMEQFQRKNKKLWEQSIAIHKEKERIGGLKREIESKHKELTDSIHYARRIQGALLPTSDSIALSLKEYFILWKPRDIVSGDFYWIKRIGNYSIIVAADCTGHGVPGAFMSMLGIAFLNEVTATQEQIQANEILEGLRTLIKDSLQQSMESRTPSDGMDMALCIIDHKNMQMQYSGANNPLFLIRDGELQQIKATRNPVSIYRREKKFEQHTLSLQEGDQFYIFSDGYLDQFGGEHEMRYTIRRFKETLLNICTLPMQEQEVALRQSMDHWQGDLKQLDDILVIGFKA